MDDNQKQQMAREALAGLGIVPNDGARGATPVPKVGEDATDDEKKAAVDSYVNTLLSKPGSAITTDESQFLRDGLRDWAKNEGFE